jgi:hypothetical protein
MEVFFARARGAGEMFGRRLFLAAFFIMPAAEVLVTQATVVEAASAECRAKPDSSAPTGSSHWYYRVDRVNQRRCWFLRSGDSRMRYTNSLKRRDLISGSTTPEIEEQSKFDGRAVAGPTPRQETIFRADEPPLGVLRAPDLESVISEDLIPHKVTSISFVQPRAGEQNARLGTNIDSVFLSVALAMGLLVAGVVVQLIDGLHRLPRAASPKLLPTFKANRSNHPPLSLKGAKLKERRERISRSNIPSLRPREILLLSGVSRTTAERQQRASRLRPLSRLDTK